MILMSLGVPRAVAMQDYLLTNELYRMPSTVDGFAPAEVLEVLWRVQEPFLNAALDAVDKDYGGVASYLENTLKVGPREQERLTALYLQSAA